MAKNDASNPPPGIQVTPVHIGGESILDRLLPHIKKIAVGVGVAIVGLMIVFTVRWWQERGRLAQTRKLTAGLELGRRAITPSTELPGPVDKPETNADPTYTSGKERAAAVLDELTKQGAMTAAGPLYTGSQMLAAGRHDAAEQEFKKVKQQPGDVQSALAREGLGLVAEARADAAKEQAEKEKHLTAAQAAFAAGKAEGEARREYALYHEGRILQRLVRRKEAAAAFTQALELLDKSEDSDDTLRQMVEHRLVAVEGAE